MTTRRDDGVDTFAPMSRVGRSALATIFGEIVHDRGNQAVFAVVSALVTLAYSLLLPFSFTQRISFHNWHYLDARLLAFSVAFGLTIGWLVTLQIYATRRLIRASGAGIGSTAAGLGVVPSLLCCTPIVPTVLGLVGLSGAGLSQTSGRIQSFFATQQDLILGASLAVIVMAGLWATRRIVRAVCLTSDGCEAPGINRGTGDPSMTGCPEPLEPGSLRERAGSSR